MASAPGVAVAVDVGAVSTTGPGTAATIVGDGEPPGSCGRPTRETLESTPSETATPAIAIAAMCLPVPGRHPEPARGPGRIERARDGAVTSIGGVSVPSVCADVCGAAMGCADAASAARLRWLRARPRCLRDFLGMPLTKHPAYLPARLCRAVRPPNGRPRADGIGTNHALCRHGKRAGSDAGPLSSHEEWGFTPVGGCQRVSPMKFVRVEQLGSVGGQGGEP